ncbi:MAG: ABC transporter permease [Aggregatilineales bacterium]
MSLSRFILRRVVVTIPILIGITLISFLVAHVVPADPITANLGQHAMSDPTIVAAFRAEWGLDQPLPAQYVVYVRNLLQGNLGSSIHSRRPVADDLRVYLPATMELATSATLIGVSLGLILGVLSAVWRGSVFDGLARFISLIGVSAPIFWLALISLAIFYVSWHIFPGPGRLSTGIQPPPTITGFLTIDSVLTGHWDALRSAISHLILPSLILGSYSMGSITRVTRAAMIETLAQDYVRTARSKGLRERVIWVRHAFRNALIPVVTVIGLSYGTLLSGAVLTETIFAWPGLGRYAFISSTTLDFPSIMGVSLVIAVIFIVINLVVDVLYYLVDPRLRTH